MGREGAEVGSELGRSTGAEATRPDRGERGRTKGRLWERWSHRGRNGVCAVVRVKRWHVLVS